MVLTLNNNKHNANYCKRSVGIHPCIIINIFMAFSHKWKFYKKKTFVLHYISICVYNVPTQTPTNKYVGEQCYNLMCRFKLTPSHPKWMYGHFLSGDTCSAGALPHQWCLSGWNGSLRVMSRSGLLWGSAHRQGEFPFSQWRGWARTCSLGSWD